MYIYVWMRPRAVLLLAYSRKRAYNAVLYCGLSRASNTPKRFAVENSCSPYSLCLVCVCVCFFTYFVRWQRLFHGKFNNLARVSENAEENRARGVWEKVFIGFLELRTLLSRTCAVLYVCVYAGRVYGIR